MKDGGDSGRAATPLPEVSVVMPVRDDQDTLPAVVADAAMALDGAARSWELIVVDDASDDASPQVLRELAEREPRIRVLVQPVAMGIGTALRRGFDAARHLVVCTCDASGRYDLRELPTWFAALRKAALVAGYRHHDGGPGHDGAGRLRWTTSRLVGVELRDPTCPIRLLRLSTAQLVNADSSGPAAFVELVLRARQLGLPWLEAPVSSRPSTARGGRPAPGLLAGARELWRLRRAR